MKILIRKPEMGETMKGVIGVTFMALLPLLSACGGSGEAPTTGLKPKVGLEHITESGQPLPTTGPFFESLGSNGRSCASCHQPEEGFSISPTHLQARF